MNLKYNFLWRRTTTILAVALLTLAIVAAISGVLIGFYYQPAAGDAYKSLSEINTAIPYGWVIYSLHNLAGNGIIVVSLFQIIAMFLGRQLQRSWYVAWVSGILLTLSTIGLGWTAMILAWNQLGYWRLKVELGIIESIPVVGNTMRNLLTGGGGVNTTTIVHFYDLHSYILSIIAIALSVIHLIALIIREQKQKALLLEQLENSINSASASQTKSTASNT